jgi:hypothetical protein
MRIDMFKLYYSPGSFGAAGGAEGLGGREGLRQKNIPVVPASEPGPIPRDPSI